MSIKIALCSAQQEMMNTVQALIQSHPQGALFEVSCFLRADGLLKQPIVYDLLMTDIEKASDDINGFLLASQMNKHTKIIILSTYSPKDFSDAMASFSFAVFATVATWDLGKLLPSLDNYLLWREDPRFYFPSVPKRVPPQRCLPLLRPHIILRMGGEKEVTLYYDEILYFYQIPASSVPQIIITTIKGEYRLRACMDELADLCRLFWFCTSDNGCYLVNPDYCTLDPINEDCILTLNKRTIKKFKPSSSEYCLANHDN